MKAIPLQSFCVARDRSGQRRDRSRFASLVLATAAAVCVMLVGAAVSATFESRRESLVGFGGQTPSMRQDPALNNLRHPAGTETVQVGTLGRVRRVGEGKKAMLLIPGIGFGDGVWT